MRLPFCISSNPSFRLCETRKVGFRRPGAVELEIGTVGPHFDQCKLTLRRLHGGCDAVQIVESVVKLSWESEATYRPPLLVYVRGKQKVKVKVKVKV